MDLKQKVAVSLSVLLVLLHLANGQQTTTLQSTTWAITPLSRLNVAFLGHKAQFNGSSALSCSVQCLEHPPCSSFSFHPATQRCFIFERRMLFGINMVREAGFMHYWKMHDECPLALGYTYVASAKACYKPVTDARLNWMEAFKACQADGGHLYIANTPEKMDVIAEFLTQNGYENLQFKLGGDDLFEEGWFLWLDGSPVTTWYTGQPDNRDGVQHCLENTRGHPDYNSDGDCSSSDRYICQMPVA